MVGEGVIEAQMFQGEESVYVEEGAGDIWGPDIVDNWASHSAAV